MTNVETRIRNAGKSSVTPSERLRRIEAVAAGVVEFYWNDRLVRGTISREAAGRILDTADEAVPVVSEAEYSAEVNDRVRVRLNVTRDAWEAMEQHAERAEAAAKDFSAALRAIRRRLEEAGCGEPDPNTEWHTADIALRAHPFFSGEEGTEG